MPIPVLSDVPEALRFLSRLPIPSDGDLKREEHDRPFMERVAPAFPIAGGLIGLIGSIVLLIALTVHLGAWVSAILAIAVTTALTGALHEDGLADCADGLGGQSVERRLEIMKDSRVGSFGVLALVLATLLKVATLQALVAHSSLAAAAALVAAGAISRVAGPYMLALLPAARAGGLAAGAGRPSRSACATGAVIGIIIAFVMVVPSFGVTALISGLSFGIITFFGLRRLARAQFGGQTGDVAGAAIALVEIAFLLGLLIFARQF
ncbi:adenosylcobinamide-GDP ribazoletransferase [Ancylobacter pratisalsi]|uniref:Adenosylcobinamide-GDP ribazoletransferase n=1 Tax=Ancylobacter pratisalsi TaxID=1745854 RepID=A0A6P1YHZ1_9HYPH|nr:adenosylcobinamide-GDP ribazoletransferase [Ancylobacter pratisalsi]QIB32879.1 adenosylcobinamide-GDP ribazoletransferase [Ancylobacter pratisalsi]